MAILRLGVAPGCTCGRRPRSLAEGRQLAGFRTAAVYLGAGENPFGARFVHATSGVTLDLLEIQSVPQTMPTG